MTIKKSTPTFWYKIKIDHWNLFSTPVRPSKSELKLWEEYLKRKKKCKTLILGSTPELRDLAHKLGHQVFLVDVNLLMILGMKRYMKYKKEETLIKADWITMPLKQDYFDYVIGDFVLGNVPFVKQDLFFKKIREILKLNGLFIHRHLFYYRKMPIKETVDYYLTLKEINKQQWNELCVDLTSSSFNKHDFTYSTTKTRENILQFNKKLFLKERKKTKKLFDVFDEIYQGDKQWWGTSPKEANNMMKKYFKIENIEYGTDHRFVNQTPIYVLKK